MKFTLSCVLAAAVTLVGCSSKPKDDAGKAGYFVGQQIGQNLKKQNLSLDQQMIVKGLLDAIRGDKMQLDEKELAEAGQIFNKIVGEKMNQMSQANLKSANEFLEANKKNPGWITTASGLQYKVLKEGKGKKPGPASTVHVHYVGTLHNGQKFDASRDRGEKPAEVKTNGVIRGWSEALQLMPEGSHWVLVIPSDLAYGPAGNGPIPPHAVLMFDVELIKVL